MKSVPFSDWEKERARGVGGRSMSLVHILVEGMSMDWLGDKKKALEFTVVSEKK